MSYPHEIFFFWEKVLLIPKRSHLFIWRNSYESKWSMKSFLEIFPELRREMCNIYSVFEYFLLPFTISNNHYCTKRIRDWKINSTPWIRFQFRNAVPEICWIWHEFRLHSHNVIGWLKFTNWNELFISTSALSLIFFVWISSIYIIFRRKFPESWKIA